MLGKLQRTARREAADLQLQTAERSLGFCQIFRQEGRGVDREDALAQAAHFHTVEAKVLGGGENFSERLLRPPFLVILTHYNTIF